MIPLVFRAQRMPSDGVKCSDKSRWKETDGPAAHQGLTRGHG